MITILINITNDQFNEFLKYSNRSHNFTYNIPIFINSCSTKFGLGAVNVYLEKFNNYNFLAIDNSYLSILFAYGYIGLFGIMLVLISIGRKILTLRNYNNYRMYTIGLFLVFILYSLYEDILFNQALLVTFIYWIEIISSISINDKDDVLI